MSVHGAGEFDVEEQDVSGIMLISAAEYRYDGGRQRYMVRQRDPNDDYAVIGDAQWRDYAGDDIHRDYTVDPAIGGGSSGHDGVTSSASYLAGVGYDDGSANAPAYFSADQIGTTRRIADSTGCDNAPPNCSPAILHRKISTAFGEPVSTANATGFDHPRYGYAGAYGYEAPRSGDPLALLGWLHVGERYYAPELGRFVQRDPIGIDGGTNCYAYVASGPVSQFDPDGLDLIDILGPFGPRGSMFGRGRLRGAKGAGLLNCGNTRLGWSWHNELQQNLFSLHGGKPHDPGHWHLYFNRPWMTHGPAPIWARIVVWGNATLLATETARYSYRLGQYIDSQTGASEAIGESLGTRFPSAWEWVWW